MIKKKNSNNSSYIYVLVYFILWVVLFEFILPVNSILPKPSIVYQSFSDLWTDYHLFSNYLSTLSGIYISLFVAYFLMQISCSFFIKGKTFLSDFIGSLNWFSKFLPGIVIGLLFIFWFPNSEYIEFIFLFVTAFTSIVIFVESQLEDLQMEYLDSARSLGADEPTISKQVVWKMIQPKIFLHILELNTYLWSLAIAFETIKGGSGLGDIFRLALKYRDLSALFSVFLIAGITVFIAKSIIKFLKNKFAFWS